MTLIRRHLRNPVKNVPRNVRTIQIGAGVIDKRHPDVRLAAIDSPRKFQFNFHEHSCTLREEFQQSVAIDLASMRYFSNLPTKKPGNKTSNVRT